MVWYMIKGFNGYEINVHGQVRSMKMMWKNPGHLLKLNGKCYTLTNDENKRVRITPNELLDIVFNGDEPPTPRPETGVYLSGRNRVFSKDKISMDFSKYIEKE